MIKKILLTVLLIAPLSLAAQKVGQFDFQTVLNALPAYKTATAEIESITNKYEADLQDMQKEFQNKLEKYQKEINEQTPVNIRQRREQELAEMQERIKLAYEDNTKSLNEARMQALQPIQIKITDAVKAVAKEGNYLFIVDKTAASSTLMIINENLSEDVTKKVMAKLGVSATAPAATPAPKK